MSKSWHPPYQEEFRRQMMALVRTGRPREELARKFEPCGETIRNRGKRPTSMRAVAQRACPHHTRSNRTGGELENEAREALRKELLEFGREVVTSDRAELIDAVGGLDDRVERVLEATNGG